MLSTLVTIGGVFLGGLVMGWTVLPQPQWMKRIYRALTE